MMTKTGRNDPCPCNSGRKFKHCCLSKASVAGKGEIASSPPPGLFDQALAHHRAGRLAEAEDLYRKILEIDPEHADSLHFLGLAAYQTMRLEPALQMIQHAIAIKPRVAMYHNNLGNVLRQLGHLADAVTSYRRALELDAKSVDALGNLGNALREQGMLDAAASYLTKAIKINPGVAFIHSHLGNVRMAQGRREEAIACYRKAISFAPNLPEANNNLGVALYEQGKVEEAIACYRTALAAQPAYVDALSNLGELLLKEMGQAEEALGLFMRAIAISGSTVAKEGFARCVAGLRFNREIEGVRPLLVEGLLGAWLRPSELAPSVISQIKLHPQIGPIIAGANRCWPEYPELQELLGAGGLAALGSDALLCTLLENAVICDASLERFLTILRSACLDEVMRQIADIENPRDLSPVAIPIVCALARQCHINEYVFVSKKEEQVRAESLRRDIEEKLATGEDIAPFWIAVAAAYFPLNSLLHANTLLERASLGVLDGLLVQQLREPEQERAYRGKIPVLTMIDEGVSQAVREQYEESPYPRWVRAPMVFNSMAFNTYLRRHLPLVAFVPLSDDTNIDVLIAGCGTGQQPINSAQRYAGAKVLAVDLSKASLAYAARKTAELGISNLTYGQADILKLDEMKREFDVIEVMGVLHHLSDPMQGWRKLVALLRPGGFMRVGLYSEFARQEISEAREFIAAHGYATTPDEIRRCRQDLIMEATAGRFGGLLESGDFYSVSACRDLLFHVQEHRFTIPQIADCLGELGLNFLGFSLDQSITKRYAARFPEDVSQTRLDGWNEYELENPSTFVGMYQFWVQKKV
ncbi:MAG: tetratricopeptide repeat protein [Chromatiaceae bacterium]|nr:tetratricopeptide repeat protein [Chromatiaceae bacterium]